MTNMWFSTESTYCFPAWTITTIAAFYLAFPPILASLHQLSSGQLARLIVFFYHLQFLPFLLLIHIASCPSMNDIFLRHPLTRCNHTDPSRHVPSSPGCQSLPWVWQQGSSD